MYDFKSEFDKYKKQLEQAMGGESAKLERLTIKSYPDAKFSSKKDTFIALVNPNTISHKVKINLKDASGSDVSETGAKGTPGSIGTEAAFHSISADTLSFKLMLDGTGVFNVHPNNEKDQYNVSEQVENLRKVCMEYIGEEHQIPFVIISWGSLTFQGRLESLGVNYTLFHPNGSPLRAEADLTFIGAKKYEDQEKKKANSSPDLTHVRVIKEGDTLPLLCEEIYSDSSKYLVVAKANNIVNFRNIKPGMEIIFPPIV